MLAPKFIPQEVKQTSQVVGNEETVKMAEAPTSVIEPQQLPLSQTAPAPEPESETELAPSMEPEPATIETTVTMEEPPKADKPQPARAQALQPQHF